MVKKRSTKERLFLLGLKIVGIIMLLIAGIAIFHYLGNYVLSLEFEPEVLCYPKDQIGISIMCEDYKSYFLNYGLQTGIGLGIIGGLGTFGALAYFGIKSLWESTE